MKDLKRTHPPKNRQGLRAFFLYKGGGGGRGAKNRPWWLNTKERKKGRNKEGEKEREKERKKERKKAREKEREREKERKEKKKERKKTRKKERKKEDLKRTHAPQKRQGLRALFCCIRGEEGGGGGLIRGLGG